MDREIILLAQDDILACSNLRAYLERIAWPSDCGVISLYCSGKYATGQGLRRVDVGGSFWGALGFVMRRQIAIELLKSPIVEKFTGNRIDNRVGRWCQETGNRLYVHTPSLIQHTGEYRSSMQHGGGKYMHAADFVGEKFDAMRLLRPKRKTSIVLPLFGCPEFVQRCLQCLGKHTANKHDVRLWIVDDCGPRTAVDAAKSIDTGIETTWLVNDKNEGFTFCVNRAIADAPDDHILILNSDAYVQNDVVGLLQQHLDRDIGLGVVGAMEFRLDVIGPHNDVRKDPRNYGPVLEYIRNNPEASAARMQAIFSGKTRAVDVMSYFCTIIRRECLHDTGPLDARLHTGLAADDLHCKVALSKSWGLALALDAFALHQGSASFKRAALPKWQLQKEARDLMRKLEREIT